MLPAELLKGDEAINVKTLSKFLERTQDVWRRACAQMDESVLIQKCFYDKKHWGM